VKMSAENDGANAGEGNADRVIVLDVVGFRREYLGSGHAPNLTDLLGEESAAELRPPFPAVTIPVQTTLATGQSPATHGDVANGEYDRETDSVAFWERDRGDRERIWEAASEAGLTTGALFFQHLIGTDADVAVTPSPIEDENNDLIEMNCWTNPDGFYDELESEHGHFPLHHYWGPGANEQSSEWILTAAREAVERYDPDLLWVYVPHLDYDAQRHGPDAEAVTEAVETVDAMVGEFLGSLRGDNRWSETAVNVVSEYGFHGVETPVFPNRALREAGLLRTRTEDTEGGPEVDVPGEGERPHVYRDQQDADEPDAKCRHTREGRSHGSISVKPTRRHRSTVRSGRRSIEVGVVAEAEPFNLREGITSVRGHARISGWSRNDDPKRWLIDVCFYRVSTDDRRR